MFVIRQPDDTMAQLPIWMCSPEASAMAVWDRPRLILQALWDLRQVLDAVLPSLSHTDAGERYGMAGRFAAAAGSEPGADTGDPGGSDPAAGGIAAGNADAEDIQTETAEKEGVDEQDRN